MKIAVVTEVFPVMSEKFIIDEVAELINLGHDVEILAFHRNKGPVPHPEVARYKLLERTTFLQTPGTGWQKAVSLGKLSGRCLSQSPASFFRFLAENINAEKYVLYRKLCLLDHFLRHDYDVVHCHFAYVASKLAFLKKYRSLKLAVSFHGHDISKPLDGKGRAEFRDILEAADLLLPVSEHFRKKLIDLGADGSKVTVHHSGIEVDAFPFKEKTFDFKDHMRLITVGRLTEKKGIERALEAVARLSQSCPNISYTIVGDGDLRTRLERMAGELGISEHVRFLGSLPQEKIRALLNESDVFLLPCRTAPDGDQEGIPNVLKEAMATGLPVVTTTHAGIPEMIKNEDNGLLSAEDDLEGLVKNISRLMSSPDECARLADAARKSVEVDYDMKHLACELVGHFAAISGEGPPVSGADPERPLLSVIIPAYNAEKTINRAINSILEQTYQNIEIVVVDDGSTDRTGELVKNYGDKVVYYHQDNQGHARARNTGLKMARGQYLAFLDSDDCWLPEKAQKQMDIFRKYPNVGLVHCDHTKIDENGELVYKYPRDPSLLTGDIFKNILLRRGHVSTSTVIFCRSCLENYGFLREDMREWGGEDREFWLKISRHCEAYYIDEPLVVYGYREKSLSRSRRVDDVVKGRHKTIDAACEGLNPIRGLFLRLRAYSAVHTELAYEFLAEDNFPKAREHYFKTYLYWPFQIRPVKGYIKSLFNMGIPHVQLSKSV